jgi:hypothetical protein
MRPTYRPRMRRPDRRRLPEETQRKVLLLEIFWQPSRRYNDANFAVLCVKTALKTRPKVSLNS